MFSFITTGLYFQIDVNGDGAIQLNELQKALEVVGIKLPQYQVRDLINKHYRGIGPNGALSISEFSDVSYFYTILVMKCYLLFPF